MYCRGCNYDLRSLRALACPECGKAFDPADTTTWLASPRPGPAWRGAIGTALVLSFLGLPVGTLCFAWVLGALLDGVCALFAGIFVAILLAPIASDLWRQDEWHAVSIMAAVLFGFELLCVLMALIVA